MGGGMGIGMGMECQASGSFIAGEAIRFDGFFRDFPKADGSQGDPIDPVIVKFTLYDRRWQKIEEISVGPAAKVGAGQYRVFHVFEDEGLYYYEWWGEGEDGLPAVERRQVSIDRLRQGR